MNTQYVQGDCIFTRINKTIKQYEYLTEDIETEVIIIGGGVTGAILGYYFSKSNIDSVILEKSRIGHGSTSITTSLLQYELDSNAMELKSYTSMENIIRSYKLGIKALDEIQEFIDKYGNKCDFKRVDSFLYTSKKLEKKEMEQEYNFRKEAGFHVEFIDEDNNPFLFDVKGGVLGKGGGAEFDPYKFTHHLIEESCKKGLRAYENTEVIDVKYSNDEVAVETVYGYKVKGKIVIVATGYNTGLFTKRAFGTKTTTFNIATKPINNIEDICKDVVFRDNNDPYNYFRTTIDNRLIIGGEDINFIPDIYNEELCSKSYEKLEQRLKNLFPNLNMEIEYRYCGAFASTQDNLGFIGKDHNNSKLWYCLGYGANGILFAILGGMMLSKLYCGEVDSDMNLFKLDRFDH
ncbi:glycine/D-amino acid oxidase-like deaminating enzyme [Clostridium punense]|uniref:Glycine/D-amino acid oxidase-like deaminating enzyme n=1 Tax=Clostridium punense TaxID=1054297 RepID=A0ABS4K306_9CLOT|nr:MULTISPECIES: FAD-binding oxidoreductase [Clostridium]EQB87915.1 oxidoreductase [Clostridium sp. BL8]MBP2021496.1 glycine/D-amino acid oxidase-like deaminating enzyme [Clostridium punense]